MDFHCQYYRKRISLLFTGELFSRRKKRTFLLNSAARNRSLRAAERRCRASAPANALPESRPRRSPSAAKKSDDACPNAPPRNAAQASTSLPHPQSAILPTLLCRPVLPPADSFADAKLPRPASSIRPAQAVVPAPTSAPILLRLPPGACSHSPPLHTRRAPRSGQVRLHVRGLPELSPPLFPR